MSTIMILFALLALVAGAVLGTTGGFQIPITSVQEEQMTSFQAISQRLLDMAELAPACAQAASQTINCDERVAEFGQREYHGSLGSTEVTNMVCDRSCGVALTAARENIQNACVESPNLFPGMTVVSAIDSIISGWGETCLRDKSSAVYCNEIIDAWPEYNRIEDMPKEELCSYCYGAKLRQMQQSEHSIYDEYFASMLEYVNRECAVDGPTAPIQERPRTNSSQPGTCFSGKTIIAQKGDTCDTIALANSVSSSTLYYINAHLLDCRNIEAGLELCLPQACTTYVVQQHEANKCVEIAVNSGAGGWMKINSWNLMVNSRCTNLWSTEPFWGHVICVSPPGGEFRDELNNGLNRHRGNGYTGGPGGFGDGHSSDMAHPSTSVAEGTTRNCGQYIQAQEGVGCAEMIISADRATPMDLFLRVNPSLGSATQCDKNLKVGVSYCLKPNHFWDDKRWRKMDDVEDSATTTALHH